MLAKIAGSFKPFAANKSYDAVYPLEDDFSCDDLHPTLFELGMFGMPPSQCLPFKNTKGQSDVAAR